MTPYSIVCELTYACPLACAYCSNPRDHASYGELETSAWARVLREASALGAVQAHFSGGEPLVRRDLEELVREARAVNLYTHLVTSGIPLDEARARRLAEAGLDAVQISLQGVRDDAATVGLACHERKLAAARAVRAAKLPLTINVVMHRGNIDAAEAIVALAASLGARRLELANVQWLGWALENQGALMPSRAQVDALARVAASAARDHAGRMEIILALPDHFRDRPRACMGGWGAHTIVVAPDGRALPCHAAAALPLDFPYVGALSLSEIWRSPAFEAFRGTRWMKEPCASCPEREKDFGGCRCQAFALTGDAARTDPACALSPDHHLVERARLARKTTLVLRR